jgi:hypothetical protein
MGTWFSSPRSSSSSNSNNKNKYMPLSDQLLRVRMLREDLDALEAGPGDSTYRERVDGLQLLNTTSHT